MTTLTRNLKLRLSADLSSDARYNLERIDQLGATFNINTLNSTVVRASGDIQLRPQDNSVGGSGSGGTIQFGDSSQPLSAAVINGPLALLSTNNTNKLTLRSSNTSDQTLTINTGAANFLLNLPITDAEVSATAAISDTKLATLITAGKVANSATTATASNTPSAIVARDGSGNFSAGIITANLLGTATAFTGNLTGDITSAGMVTSIAPGAIVDGDINVAAAIAGSKISPVFGNQLVSSEQGYRIVNGAHTTTLLPASVQSSSLNLRLPAADGTAGAVLTTDGSGNLSFALIAGSGTVTSVGLSMPSLFTVTNSPVISSGTLAASLNVQAAGQVLAGPASGPAAEPSFRQLSSDELSAGSINKFYTSTLFNSDLATKTTSDLAEGTALYHTDTRARTAAVADSITSGITNIAPSQNAVFNALSLKLDTSLKGAINGLAELDGTGKVPLTQIPSGVGAVQSVNTKTGSVVLNTDDILEVLTPTNKWFTDLRAKTAAVSNTITSGIVDVAPSQDAVFLGLQGKANSVHTHTASNITDFTSAARTATVEDLLVDGITNIAPSQNVVFDALAGKAALVHTHTASAITDFSSAAKSAAVSNSISAGVVDVAPSQNAVFDALALKLNTSLKGAVNGLAELGSDGKIPSSQIPAIAITDTFVVASQAAMLALVAEKGDVAVRTDLNKSFILSGTDPAILANWQELLTPTDAVLSVNGQTGTVSLTTSNIAEGTNLYHTALRAQDAAGSLATSTATAQMSYVTGTSLSVSVLPAGFINSTSGLASASNILRIDPTQATAKTGVVGADALLIADSADSNTLKRVTVSDIVNLSGAGYSTTWTSGTSIAVTHGLGTRNVLVEVYDNTTYETVLLDTVVRTDTNTVTLTASQAPSGAGLTVLIKRVI